MIFIGIWMASLIATIYLADQKKLNMSGFVILAIATGPLAVIIALLSERSSVRSSAVNEQKPVTIEAELSELKRMQAVLNSRIANLEKIILYPSPVEARQLEASQDMSSADLPATSETRQSAPTETTDPRAPLDMEMMLGRNWLNKIGIVIFMLGMGFLISYSFKYFGPFVKIAFGYGVSAVLFFFGLKTEGPDKLKSFSRVLLGGAWALVYFTTYAMHHFAAARLIENQTLDLILLGVVAVGMMVHASRFQSEGMMSVALFVAFFTTTMGHVSIFTLLSTVLLGLLILFLVYRFQWTKILAMGVILTYGFHQLWILPKLQDTQPEVIRFVFLTAYALVYFVGVHLLRIKDSGRSAQEILAINGGNIGLYVFLSYGLISDLFFAHRFEIALGMGSVFILSSLLMKGMGRRSLYLSDLVCGVFVLTFAVSLKFMPGTRILIWLLEAPFLLFISQAYQEKVYRLLAYAVSLVGTFAILFWHPLWNWGWSVESSYEDRRKIVLFCAAVSMGLCSYILQAFRADPKNLSSQERFFDHGYSLLSFFYGTWFLAVLVKAPWTTLSAVLEGLALVVLSVVSKIQRFRYYAYVIMGLGVMGILVESFYGFSKFKIWLICLAGISSLVLSYGLAKIYKDARFLFVLAVLLTIGALFKWLNPTWITLSLGGIGVVTILAGMLTQDKTVRLGGMVFLLMTIGRIVIVEIAGLDIIYKIITLIGIGLLLLGISYVYNRILIINKK